MFTHTTTLHVEDVCVRSCGVISFVGNTQTEAHLFSLYLIIPYIAVTVPLLYYNWYVKLNINVHFIFLNMNCFICVDIL